MDKPWGFVEFSGGVHVSSPLGFSMPSCAGVEQVLLNNGVEVMYIVFTAICIGV